MILELKKSGRKEEFGRKKGEKERKKEEKARKKGVRETKKCIMGRDTWGKNMDFKTNIHPC